MHSAERSTLHLQQSGEDLISKESHKVLIHVCSCTDPRKPLQQLLRATLYLGQTLTQLIFPLTFTSLLGKTAGPWRARRKTPTCQQVCLSEEVLEREFRALWLLRFWMRSSGTPSDTALHQINTPNCRIKLSSFPPRRNPESVCSCRLCHYSFLPGKVLVLAALAAVVACPLGEVHKCEDRQHL